MDENVEYMDTENYNRFGKKKDGLTYKQIILNQIQKISQNVNCEFRGGYWEQKPHPNPSIQTPIENYIEDTREIYSHSIEFLHDLLSPHFDDKTKKKCDEINKEVKKILEDNTIIKEKDKEYKDLNNVTINNRIFKDIDDRMSFRSQKALINRKLFIILCDFYVKYEEEETSGIDDEI